MVLCQMIQRILNDLRAPSYSKLLGNLLLRPRFGTTAVDQLEYGATVLVLAEVLGQTKDGFLIVAGYIDDRSLAIFAANWNLHVMPSGDCAPSSARLKAERWRARRWRGLRALTRPEAGAWAWHGLKAGCDV
jgi:hypothetical protein